MLEEFNVETLVRDLFGFPTFSKESETAKPIEIEVTANHHPKFCLNCSYRFTGFSDRSQFGQAWAWETGRKIKCPECGSRYQRKAADPNSP